MVKVSALSGLAKGSETVRIIFLMEVMKIKGRGRRKDSGRKLETHSWHKEIF